MAFGTLNGPEFAWCFRRRVRKITAYGDALRGGWGVGGVFFGLGIAALGLSLGLSLIMRLVAIGGSVVPLMMKYPEQVLRPAGLVLIAGIVVIFLGMVACARAGQLKDRSTRGSEPGKPGGPRRKASFKLGVLFCIASGLTSALVNFALIFGREIAAAATRQGASPSDANNDIWALVFTSNYVVNVAYCVYLAKNKHTFTKFLSGGLWSYWAAAVYLGVFWAGGNCCVRGWRNTNGAVRGLPGLPRNAHCFDPDR